jgi:rhodanese-related sulfurtransferase
VKGFVLAAGMAVLLTGCEDGTPPAEPTAPVPTKKPEPKPAKKPIPAGKLTEISLDAFFPKQQSGAVLVYDARPAFVSAFGKIPGAIPWPKSEYDVLLPQREKEIRDAKDDGKTVVIYCTDLACPDAQSVGERLITRGHDVAILKGGFAAWKETGLPTE